MADIKEFISKYSTYQTTFKEVSFDSQNNQHLCLDETISTFNFDAIISDIYPNPMTYRPKSFDSIFIDGDTIYCIEFKNERKPDKNEVEQKLINGKQELEKLLVAQNIQKDEYKFIFCLVCNIFKPKEERYKRGILNYPLKMYLQKHKETNFVDDIFTEDVEFFLQQFKKIGRKLVC